MTQRRDKDFNTQRRIREEEQVELRAQRAEEFLNKKREVSKESHKTNAFEAYRDFLFSKNLEDIYNALCDCRTKLSVEVNPPIQEAIDSGLVPRIVELLDKESYTQFGEALLPNKCRFEAAWVVTNIASGTSDQTKYVVKLGSVPLLTKMIAESDISLVDQCIWALGNISGDGEELRDIIHETGAFDKVIELIGKYISSTEHIKMVRNLTWVLSNLNRGRKPFPTYENMQKTLPVIEKLIMINDKHIVTDSYWCLSYLLDASSEIVDTVLRSPIMNRTFSLLENFTAELQKKACNTELAKICAGTLRAMIASLGNIVTGNEEQTNTIIQMGFVQFLHPIFYLFENKSKPIVSKDICWILSNITAGTPEQIRYVVDSDFLGLIIDVVSTKYGLAIRKEASIGLHNILYFCVKNPEYLIKLLEKGVIQALQSFMMAIDNYPDLQAQVLDSVRYALESAEKIEQKTGSNPVTEILINTKFVDEIEALQDSRNEIVENKAYNIIMKYFDGEEQLM